MIEKDLSLKKNNNLNSGNNNLETKISALENKLREMTNVVEASNKLVMENELVISKFESDNLIKENRIKDYAMQNNKLEEEIEARDVEIKNLENIIKMEKTSKSLEEAEKNELKNMKIVLNNEYASMKAVNESLQKQINSLCEGFGAAHKQMQNELIQLKNTATISKNSHNKLAESIVSLLSEALDEESISACKTSLDMLKQNKIYGNEDIGKIENISGYVLKAIKVMIEDYFNSSKRSQVYEEEAMRIQGLYEQKVVEYDMLKKDLENCHLTTTTRFNNRKNLDKKSRQLGYSKPVSVYSSSSSRSSRCQKKLLGLC
ncbi:uncharacterized protein ASCRUDRAFT_80500 [Ascoidea rubescens DSM 1968]|uniref:Uncharacterized protein n=1 Tax=Ascoidea rubescens DSM 1968 TaxID=1344418 RepID=A0A1D2VIS0_9ASCO|nr:hypothetical protein ASCRUDRAFT_80500 [Ascoidea rubescens DSM 1968]ODV61403.1 hypothetical protein ASCRUDRAFT_80500 [Ascoidea rubescens DSM 1968]